MGSGTGNGGAGRIVVRDHANAASRGGTLARKRLSLLDLGPEQRAHPSFSDGNGGLHRPTTRFKQSRGVGKRECTGSAKCGIFAERMSGNHARMARKVKAGFALHDPDDREARSHADTR